jgi:hypothetical protein
MVVRICRGRIRKSRARSEKRGYFSMISREITVLAQSGSSLTIEQTLMR